ncbi:MAG: hypothetical protein IPL78_33715 [Chloroflexi bacterium]|nr:hypothetical protein [Chloroflexota bacterium]
MAPPMDHQPLTAEPAITADEVGYLLEGRTTLSPDKKSRPPMCKPLCRGAPRGQHRANRPHRRGHGSAWSGGKMGY